MAIDIDFYTKAYFYFDIPAIYNISDESQITIYPIMLKDSEIFLASARILQFDKNASPDVEIIQMSYLEFLVKKMFPVNKMFVYMLWNILHKCLNVSKWSIEFDKRNKPVLICYIDDAEYKITSKQFDDITKIILYQNILHYDDTYINPEIRKNMEEQDRLKMSNIVPPNTERRIAIITAHCGVLKSDQLNMTMRSHQALFDEVCGEVEFTTIRPIAIYGGKGKELEHWIYKDKKNKFDGYSTSVEQFNKSMGGDGTVLSAGNTARGDALLSRMNDMK